MKFGSRILLLTLAALLLTLLAGGCSGSGKPPALLPVARGEDGKDLKPVLVKDPAVEEALWQDYLDDPSLLPPFQDPDQLEESQLLSYALTRYLRAEGARDLAPVEPPEGEENNRLWNGREEFYLLPLDQANRLVERYFGRTLETPQDITLGYPVTMVWYGEEQGGFVIAGSNPFPKAEPPKYAGEQSTTAYVLDRCWDNGDGLVAAVYSLRLTPEDKEPSEVYTALLERRADGSYRWRSLDLHYPNYNKAQLKGYYQLVQSGSPLDQLRDVNGYYLGQNDQSVYLARREIEVLEEGDRFTFYQLSRQDYAVTRSMTLGVEAARGLLTPLLKDLGDQMMLLTYHTIYQIPHSLAAPKQTPLPPALAKQLTLVEPKEGEGGGPHYPHNFRGYDVSADLSKFVYADDRGVHLYQLEVPADELAKRIEDAYWAGKAKEPYTGPPIVTGEDLLLEAHPDAEAGEGTPQVRYGTPRFVADGTAILLTTETAPATPGGEAIVTTRLIPLTPQEAPEGWNSDLPWLEAGEAAAQWPEGVTFDEDKHGGIFPLVAGQHGLFFTQPGEPAQEDQQGQQDPEQQLLYYDFATGQTTQIFAGSQQLPQAAASRTTGRMAVLTQPVNPHDKKARIILYGMDPDAPQGTAPRELLSASPQTRLDLLAALDDQTYLCYYYISQGEQGLIKIRETR